MNRFLLTLGAAALLLSGAPGAGAQTAPRKKTTAPKPSTKKKTTKTTTGKNPTGKTASASTPTAVPPRPTPAPAAPAAAEPVVVAAEAPIEEAPTAAPGVGSVLMNALIGQLQTYAAEKLQLQKRLQGGDATAASGLAALTGKVQAVQSQLTAANAQATMTTEQAARYKAASDQLAAPAPAASPGTAPALPTLRFGQ